MCLFSFSNPTLSFASQCHGAKGFFFTFNPFSNLRARRRGPIFSLPFSFFFLVRGGKLKPEKSVRFHCVLPIPSVTRVSLLKKKKRPTIPIRHMVSLVTIRLSGFLLFYIYISFAYIQLDASSHCPKFISPLRKNAYHRQSHWHVVRRNAGRACCWTCALYE